MTERPHNRIVTEHERTTTEVLVAYRMSAFGYNDMPDDAPHDPEELAEVDAEFHNWLEQVKAEAWEEWKRARPLPTRDEIKKVLQREFGSFLAHDPANPARFWGQSADAVLALLKGQE